MNICFLGGRQAGMIGLLTAMSEGVNVVSSVSYSDEIDILLERMGVPVYKSVKDKEFIKSLENIDLILSVHCREIVDSDILKKARLGGINVHPYLYKYKGEDPVGRALEDGECKASVGVHHMTDLVDEGEVLVEEFIDVAGTKTSEEVYRKLYPYYCLVISKALRMVM